MAMYLFAKGAKQPVLVRAAAGCSSCEVLHYSCCPHVEEIVRWFKCVTMMEGGGQATIVRGLINTAISEWNSV